MTNTYYTFLPNRAAVILGGEDVSGFLQSFLTQDMKLLDDQNLIYSALLTPQGKMDFDFFVSKQEDHVLLETEDARAEALAQRLSTFRLRRKITINILPVQVVAVWNESDTLNMFPYPSDPRHKALGYRKNFLEYIDKTELNQFEQTNLNFYDRLRLGVGVPDGSRDIAWGEDTPADIHLEKWNGVSYTKGCYLGQELTWRMYHRNLGKRGLYPVRINGAPLPAFTDIVTPDGDLIGEMRSSNGDMGLALLRHDSLSKAARAGLSVLQDAL